MLAIFIIIGVITAVSLYDFYTSRSWQTVTSESRNETVFEKRNKRYGAYEIRKDYNKRFILILLGFTVGLGGISAASSAMITHANDNKKTMVDIEIPLTWDEEPKPEDPIVEPPKSDEPAGAMAEMTAFIEPTISNHAEIEPINIVDPTTPIGPVDHEGDDEWNNITITTPQKPGGGIIEIIPPVKTPVDVVDEPALFPGGIQALRTYISENLDLDNVFGTAKVHLKFVVDENGEISTVKISGMKGECEGCKEAAIAVVKSMPKWTPGKVNGEVVSSYYSLPIQITSE